MNLICKYKNYYYICNVYHTTKAYKAADYFGIFYAHTYFTAVMPCAVIVMMRQPLW